MFFRGRVSGNRRRIDIDCGRAEIAAGGRASRISALRASGAALLAAALAGCSPSATDRLHGYIEGDYVYVASPFAGALEELTVRRGAEVKAGDPLFTLARMPEQSARDEAEKRLGQARAALEDARKGLRPSEIEALSAALKQAQAALDLSEKELARQEKLAATPGATTEQAIERARAARDQDRQRAAQLEAELATARLGARDDQVAAAAANVQALEAALAEAEWALAQKSPRAPQAGLVFDTLYREGEWVAAGRPVVVLLPPANVKLRVFVPEPMLGALALGDPVQVLIDGVEEPVAGRLSFISPSVEYSPPVIYSRENRSKLVFLVEAEFEPAAAARLHPGQPVDVRFQPARRP